MCLICVEFINQRMTRDEVRKALPEMIMYAKTDEDRSHYKRLLNPESSEEFFEEVKNHSKLSTASKVAKPKA